MHGKPGVDPGFSFMGGGGEGVKDYVNASHDFNRGPRLA